MTDDFIDETLDPSPHASLTPEGIRVTRALVPWRLVLDVVLLPKERPASLYVLAPRRPPAPPWYAISSDELDPALRDAGLSSVASQIRLRMNQSGYRHVRIDRPAMTSRELLELVLAREEIPGALEVPVGRGPVGLGDHVTRAAFGVVLGSTAGLVLGATAGAAGIPAMLAGAAAGIAAPSAMRALGRRRRRRPRVLVLAPDGCVIGFPTGVRAFGWEEVERFASVMAAPAGRAGDEVPHLEVMLAAAGRGDRARIEGSWFDGPLPLIVSIANAYRERHVR